MNSKDDMEMGLPETAAMQQNSCLEHTINKF